MTSNITPFYNRAFLSVKDAFKHGLNERYWRHGITLSQGNGWNVSKASVKDRLSFVRSRLLRVLFGNNWRRKGWINFMVFKHGSETSYDEHYHALMGIEGKHEQSDPFIAETIELIETQHTELDPASCFKRYQKPLHVDWLKDSNDFHDYVARHLDTNCDNYFII
jgi:hypothetical protein